MKADSRIFGKIEITNKDERFCIKIPEEGALYVHENISDNEFILDKFKRSISLWIVKKGDEE